MNNQTQTHNAPLVAREHHVRLIPIAMDIKNAQTSGLAWYGDNLIILPQYPNWRGTPGDGCLQVLHKSDILDFLDRKPERGVERAVTPYEVPLITSGLEKQIPGFQGYEAIAVVGDRVFLTIEAEPDGMMGYIVGGAIAPDMREVRLDSSKLVQIEPEAAIENASFETLVVAGDKLVAIYENNGAFANLHPVAYVFDFSFNLVAKIPFPNVEYRVTDATHTDEKGQFWAMNFYYPGGKKEYQQAPDQLVARYGKGPTHAKYNAVERLVHFQYSDTGISLVEEPPIQLELIDETHCRNWEGLVELDDRGFLIITDEFPTTLLGFVKREA